MTLMGYINSDWLYWLRWFTSVSTQLVQLQVWRMFSFMIWTVVCCIQNYFSWGHTRTCEPHRTNGTAINKTRTKNSSVWYENKNPLIAQTNLQTVCPTITKSRHPSLLWQHVYCNIPSHITAKIFKGKFIYLPYILSPDVNKLANWMTNLYRLLS